jgi:hypothetical protein
MICTDSSPKEINYPAAEQRGINRNIPNRPKGRGINAPEAHKTSVRRVSGGFTRRICGGLVRRTKDELTSARKGLT